MDTTFILFGQRPFNNYAFNRLSAIEESINSMSELEILMYKDNFEELIKKFVSSYSLLPVTISFEDKIVDLVSKPDITGNRYFAEYTLVIKGDSELLKLDPYNLGYVSFTLPVDLKTNMICFEIDTCQYSEDLSVKSMTHVKQQYDAIKEFIASTLLNLNNESQKFNLQLEDFIIPILAKKMRSANNHNLIKERLNFK